MKKIVRISSEYGPLEIEIVYCDGKDCLNKGPQAFLPGWLVVEPFGIQIGTFSSGPIMLETTHYCSTDCLKKVL